MRIETQAVHSSRPVDAQTGAIAPPVHLSTTFQRDEDGGYSQGYVYIRNGNPTRNAFENAMAEIEEGAVAAAFSSGLGAASAIFQSLAPGDRVIAPRDVYHGLRALLDEIISGWGVRVDYVDMHTPGALEGALGDGATLVWVETPSNPLLRVTDIRRVADAAHRVGAVCACDNTFATPIQQRPIAFGADLVVHATTKWIGGHSDMQGGCVVSARESDLFEKIRRAQCLLGAVPSPFDCWLAMRGLSTLACRVRTSTESAGKIAEFLDHHRGVERVHYPGLASHPDHAVAANQMDGYGGIISFETTGGETHAMRTAAKVHHFTRATSLGGVESLIEHRASIEGPGSTTPAGLLRLSIGLEHPDDLIEDLDQALNAS